MLDCRKKEKMAPNKFCSKLKERTREKKKKAAVTVHGKGQSREGAIRAEQREKMYKADFGKRCV